MDPILLLLFLPSLTLFVHSAPLLNSVVTDDGVPVTSLPVIVNADGRPLGVSLSEARHIVALDGRVFVALPAASNVTLTLEITPLEGLIDASFVSSRLVGEELVVGSTSDCLYQVTLVDNNEGRGLVNLCDNLRGYVYTGDRGYSIVQTRGVAHGVTVNVLSTALPVMPPLTEANKATERTRAVVKQRYIELLVVVDHTTLEWHVSQDVESYILTLINLASRVLKDSSLGQPIEVVVKKLVMLERPDPKLKLVSNVAVSAKRFIRWKNKYEKDTREDYDLALLLTRVNLKHGGIDHAGHAITGGICQADSNCILVEDGGLTSSYTIAHEIGHSLGLGHDGEGDNDCNDRPYLMSGTTYASAQSPLWSSCSRNKLDELLRFEPYQCLHNKPTTFSIQQLKSLVLPGEKYGRDKQCQLRHGPSATSCDIEDQCAMLWCQLPGSSCMTNQMSVADGTPCTIAANRAPGVCVDRQCSPAVNRTVINGQWGEWSGWSNCSRTCGVGMAYSERFCDSPKPSNGGSYCVGEQKRYRTCNIQDCLVEENSGNHRDEQCKSYGDKWRALDEGIQLKQNPCKLYCEASSEGTFKVFAAADGTRCKAGSLDMCVAGQCTPVGCDKQLRSNATLDRCGVCNGDGSTCVEKSGTLALKHLGLNRIAVVPKGAFKVIIREKESTANYIVAEDNHGMLFNGSNVSSTHEVTKVQFSGLDWEYGRPQNGPEFLMASGTSTEDVTVAVFVEEDCRGIEYSYLAPVGMEEPAIMAERYSWHYTFWSSCSVTCGQGVSTSVPRCFNSLEQQVSSKYCKELPKPNRQKRKCSLPKCATASYDWRYTQWSGCSATCGGGVKRRTVHCMAIGETAVIVDTSLCSQSKKAPVSTKVCNKKACPYTWSLTDWTNCSVECGMGYMTRAVRCIDAQGNVVDDEKCTADTKPAVTKQCFKNGNHCQLLWQYTPWSECSVTCGMGIRTRTAECRYLNGTAAAISLCTDSLGSPSAADKEECSTGRDCSTECRDDDGYKNLCPLVKSGNLCSMENLRRQCCQTCQDAD